VLSTAQYGTVDLYITTANLLLPVLTLSVADGLFRFILDKGVNYSGFLTTSMIFTVIIGVIGATIGTILIYFGLVNYGIFIFYLVLLELQTLLQNYVKARNRIWLFAINGILSAASLAVIVTVLIVHFEMGVRGYLLGMIVSAVISIMLLLIFGHIFPEVQFTAFSGEILKRLLVYSVPLIPNAFLWYFTNEASRFFILGFIGIEANGIYAVATKIPTIINIFYTVFSQAWQISAVNEFSSQDKSKFYSNIFNVNALISLLLISLLVIFIKPIILITAGSNYFSAWKIVPVLLLASFFSNLSSILGTTYLAAKRTSGIMTTTFLGMVINVAMNFILIPTIGLQGAGLGAMLGFFAVVILRLLGSRSLVIIKPDIKRLSFSFMVVLSLIILQFTSIRLRAFSIVSVVLTGLLILMNIRSFRTMIKEKK
jgi:O-antigen/teichoic acid export membrane protein